jgi:hypothetical protein
LGLTGLPLESEPWGAAFGAPAVAGPLLGAELLGPELLGAEALGAEVAGAELAGPELAGLTFSFAQAAKPRAPATARAEMAKRWIMARPFLPAPAPHNCLPMGLVLKPDRRRLLA